MNKRGVTLLELLIAVVLVVLVVSSLSYLFPSASKAMVSNRQRTIGGHLADTLMNAEKKFSFDLLAPTDEISANFPSSGVGGGAGKCDCGQDIGSVPPITVTTINNIAYTQQVCINLMDQNMQSYCPSDTGLTTPPGEAGCSLKHIRVRVTWASSQGTSSTDLDNMRSRL